jgi:hypothetical protein
MTVGQSYAGRQYFVDEIKLRDGTVYPVGSCCVRTGFETGTCVKTGHNDCESALGGTYQGDFTECGSGNGICDFSCPDPFADADDDGDVDLVDFGLFQACLTGSGYSSLSDTCMCFDRGGDNDVDSKDFRLFRNCISGPSNPADAGCDDAF